MGGGPYKFAKRGVEVFFVFVSVSAFNHKRAPMHADSNSISLNPLIANNYRVTVTQDSAASI